MISVLIPTYNYDVRRLVEALYKQLQLLEIDWEIIIQDDASTQKNIVDNNLQFIKSIDHKAIQYILLSDNIGNGENRNVLGEKAKYPWLLYLDSDMMPITDDFISNYIKEIQMADFEVLCGGIVYPSAFQSLYPLKYKHGQTEVWSFPLRGNPYLHFRGNNFVIRKSVKLEQPFRTYAHTYGYVDTLFGLELGENKRSLKLIDNPVYHMDGVNADVFIEKNHKSLDNLANLYQTQNPLVQEIKLIQWYEKLESWKLMGGIRFLYRNCKDRMLKNLKSQNPNFYILQGYKLGYFSDQLKRSQPSQ